MESNKTIREKLVVVGDLILYKIHKKNNNTYYTVNLNFPKDKILLTSISFDEAENYILNY